MPSSKAPLAQLSPTLRSESNSRGRTWGMLSRRSAMCLTVGSWAEPVLPAAPPAVLPDTVDTVCRRGSQDGISTSGEHKSIDDDQPGRILPSRYSAIKTFRVRQGSGRSSKLDC